MRKPENRDEASSTLVPGTERAREVLMTGVLVWGLTCGSPGLCGEHVRYPEFEARDTRKLNSGIAPRFDIGARALPDLPPAPGAQFSPRKYFAPDQQFEPAFNRAQSLGTTTVWQRLRDYRSKSGVRLVTLFETAGSSVSLQAGRHGAPSLQWTSRTLNRGGSTRGLLDHLVAASLGAAGIAFTQPGSSNAMVNPSAVASTLRPVRPVIAAATSHAP